MLNADKKQVDIASEFQELDHSHPFQPQAMYMPLSPIPAVLILSISNSTKTEGKGTL